MKAELDRVISPSMATRTTRPFPASPLRRPALVVGVLLLAGAIRVGLPADTVASFPPPKPLHIGVGGDYPNGLDGQLSARGYPWERIFPWELNQPEVLAKFDVILLSCVPETVSGIDQALLYWIKAGGHAYVETWAAQNRFPLQSLVSIYSNAPETGDVVLTLPSHPLAAGLDLSKPFDMHHLQGLCVSPRSPNAAQVLAHYCVNGGSQPIDRAPAMLSMSLGQGELVYSAAPVAFARFHRGRSSEALLVAIINYLLPNGRAPRLLYTEPANTAPPGSGPRFVVPESERDHDDEPPPALGPPPLAVPRAGRLPDGFELLDCVAEEPYDVLAQAAAGSGAGTQPTIVLLDGRFDDGGKALRPALWLTLTPRRIELRSGKDPSAKPVAAVDWQAPDTPAPLLIRRRPGLVSVVAGATEVLHVRASSAPGGAVAVCAGGVTLSDPVCQPVAPAVFDDDFMREAGPATLWTPVSGTWTNVGVGDEEYSINGFYYLGRSDQTALATAGDWFWEDYSLSAAVRPNAAGTQVGRTVRSTVSPPSAKAGDAQVGLCALVQDNGDYLAFVADPASAASPKLRLTRTLSGAQTVLAETDGGLTPGQWYRLGLRLHDGTLEALLDGETVLTCPDPEVRGGGVGLLVSGGSARFDDVVVRPNSEAIRVPRDEGSPVAELPPSLGPHDTLTWGSPATPWEADPEHPSILWHDGFFPGDFDLSLKVRPASEPALRRLILAPAFSSPENQRLTVALSLAGGSSKAEIAWQKPGGKPAVKRVTLRDQAVLQLSRHAGKLTVLWCGQAVCQADARRHTRLALEVFGPPVRAKDLTVRSAGAHDYVFGAAPTDWWISSGVWEVSARWACDDRWSWLAGWATGDAAIWNKRRFDGDVAVDCYVGVKMNAPGGPETARCRDYNLVLCGDRQDPRSGYSFILGGDGGVKTQLLKNGQVVAEAPTIRVPAGYNVHHCWFRVRASRIGNVISYDFERRPVFRYEDPDPLPGGYVGLWTRNSGIMIPRVTIWSCPDRG